MQKGLHIGPAKGLAKLKGWHCKHKHATKLQAKMENAKYHGVQHGVQHNYKQLSKKLIVAQVFGLATGQTCKSFCWPCKRADFVPCKRAPLAMMKAARKRGGNSAPPPRMPFPTVSQEALDKALMSYTRAMGIKQAFNLHQYKNLQKEQAESPQSIAALAKLVENLLVCKDKVQSLAAILCVPDA